MATTEKPTTVLIVEDEAIVGEDLKDDLLSRRYQVAGPVHSAAQAIEMAAQILPDVVLMDIVLRRAGDGISTANRIRSEHDIPIIFLSALSDQETLLRARQAEPFAYIVKPYSALVLTTTIELAVQRHRSTRMIKDAEERYRILARQVQAVREEEAGRISREIHDELGQELTAIKMDLQAAIKDVPAGSVAGKRLRSADRLVDQTLGQVRRISSELRPRMLDELGFFEAAEWLVENFRERTNLQVEFAVGSPLPRLGDAAVTAAYRILQESITNVMRHAKASRVKVSITFPDQFLVMSISDNGTGFEGGSRNSLSSSGIAGMEDRALALGGELTVDSAAGGGATVTARIPLSVGDGGDGR